MRKFFISIVLFFAGMSVAMSQGYLHTEGKNIVDANGDNFIIRSIGTGNWMIQEGYMMQTAGVANTQHEFRDRLIDIIGEEKTDEFYEAWLANHFTRADVDSLAAWGFNTIRPALHYKWFTPPIEDEPVPGELTWLETGFDYTDSLVKWCSENELYVIFDMHGAPGGQGANADISDYDPTKPSLWESEDNKTKLVELWKKIAERYSDEPWVGGYDLVNETNWTFPEGNNSQMLTLFKRITDSIRLVDQNHIIIIEGNSWANDYSGLKPAWDDNMVYSFHKYWTYNNENSLDWVINEIRNGLNVPIWLGEAGENSNTWFTNLIDLCERKNIGWSWWPVKKVAQNNPMRVIKNDDYDDLVEYWRGNKPEPSADAAFAAVMTFAERHNIKNCSIQYDVIDAMMRQPYTKEVKPFKELFTPDDIIFATDYDLGRNGYAYYDTDTANYNLETDNFVAWNAGYAYRNDGVDIEACTDSEASNGYNVGWTADGEWLSYSMHCDTAVLVDGIVRSASGGSGSSLVLEIDGKAISGIIDLPGTGGWQSWRSTSFSNVLLPAGDYQLRVRFIEGGSNFNYIEFSNFRSPDELVFAPVICETSVLGNELSLSFNRAFTSEGLSPSDFTLIVNGAEAGISSIEPDATNPKVLKLFPEGIMPYNKSMTLSYSGVAIISGEEVLADFSDLSIANNLATFYTPPAKIQAENFIENKGFALEDCSDAGGGLNTGYANYGDYLDYMLYVEEEKDYLITMRVALGGGNASVKFMYENEGSFDALTTMSLTSTGGWQTWEDQDTKITLPEGKYLFRIYSLSGEHNINWFKFSPYVGVENTLRENGMKIYPNPVNNSFRLDFSNEAYTSEVRVKIFNMHGALCHEAFYNRNSAFDVSNLTSGIYLLGIETESDVFTSKIVINSN